MSQETTSSSDTPDTTSQSKERIKQETKKAGESSGNAAASGTSSAAEALSPAAKRRKALILLRDVSPLFFLLLLFGWIQMNAAQTEQRRLLDIPRERIMLDQIPVISEAVGASAPTASDMGDTTAHHNESHTKDTQKASRALKPAPNPELIERGIFGTLPRISEAGSSTPWRYYAAPAVEIPDENAALAIVFTGLGLSDQIFTQALEDLPPEISLSYNPYVIGLNDKIQKARKRGHEALIDIPLQPLDTRRSDLGPFMLTLEASTKENLERLDWVMSRAAGYIGFANIEGLKFVQYDGLVQPLVEELARRGLSFIDYLPNVSSRIRPAAEAARLPMVPASFTIDETLTAESIQDQLNRAAAMARERGQLTVYARAYPLTITTLKNWIEAEAERQNMTLVPVSQLMRE